MDGLKGIVAERTNRVDSDVSDGNEIEYKGARQRFTEYLDLVMQAPVLHPDVNSITVQIVDRVNQQLVKDQVSMSEAHCDVAIQSIARGDEICQFTLEENDYVVESEGQGLLYNAAKAGHKVIHAAKQDAKPGEIERMQESQIQNYQ